MKTKQKRFLKNILNFYTLIGVVCIIAGTVFLLSPLYPYLFFQINQDALVKEQTNVTTFADLVSNNQQNTVVKENNTLPPKDSSLTSTNTLLIPSIGVVGKINENKLSKAGLDKGIWRVFEWGNPIKNDYSIILAAHRYGYITWSNKFRTQNSFYNLPKTKVGDNVEIIWDQRRFVYKIYKSQEGTKITDYSADLILYTCKSLNSDIRVFRYAKRVN